MKNNVRDENANERNFQRIADELEKLTSHEKKFVFWLLINEYIDGLDEEMEENKSDVFYQFFLREQKRTFGLTASCLCDEIW